MAKLACGRHSVDHDGRGRQGRGWGHLISLRRCFYESCKQEVRSYLRWRACLVSSGSGPAVNMKSGRRPKTLPCSSSGEYKSHSVWPIPSSAPSALRSSVNCCPGDQGRAGARWQPIKARQVRAPARARCVTAPSSCSGRTSVVGCWRGAEPLCLVLKQRLQFNSGTFLFQLFCSN